MFCGLSYDEFNKMSYFVGSIITNSIKRHKVLGLGSIPSNSSQIVCNCDAPLKCHKTFVIDHHISCSVQENSPTVTAQKPLGKRSLDVHQKQQHHQIARHQSRTKQTNELPQSFWRFWRGFGSGLWKSDIAAAGRPSPAQPPTRP